MTRQRQSKKQRQAQKARARRNRDGTKGPDGPRSGGTPGGKQYGKGSARSNNISYTLRIAGGGSSSLSQLEQDAIDLERCFRKEHMSWRHVHSKNLPQIDLREVNLDVSSESLCSSVRMCDLLLGIGPRRHRVRLVCDEHGSPVSITAADAALENFVITCQYMFEEQERAGQNVLGGKEKGKNAPRHSRLYGGGKGVYFNTLTTMAVAFQETCSDLLQLSEVACNGEESFPSMTDWEKVILPTIVKALKANILGVDAWENSEWKARVERAVHVHRSPQKAKEVVHKMFRRCPQRLPPMLVKYIPFSNYEDSGRVDFGFSNENVKLSPGNKEHAMLIKHMEAHPPLGCTVQLLSALSRRSQVVVTYPGVYVQQSGLDALSMGLTQKVEFEMQFHSCEDKEKGIGRPSLRVVKPTTMGLGTTLPIKSFYFLPEVCGEGESKPSVDPSKEEIIEGEQLWTYDRNNCRVGIRGWRESLSVQEVVCLLRDAVESVSCTMLPLPQDGEVLITSASVPHLKTTADFWNKYRVYSPESIEHPFSSSQLRGRILLSPSALEEVGMGGDRSSGDDHDDSTQVMTYELTCTSSGHRVFVGVLEFSAPENTVVMSSSLRDDLGLTDGDDVEVRCVSLPRGNAVSLQPLSPQFNEVKNLRALLEWVLPSYVALCEGQIIRIPCFGEDLEMRVHSVVPMGAAISIAESDLDANILPIVGLPTHTISDTNKDANTGNDGLMKKESLGKVTLTPSNEANHAICPHCCRSVPSATMSLHSLRCERINYYCDECDKVVHVREKALHIVEGHSSSSCSDCQMIIPNRLMSKHQRDECHKRTVTCSFCELELPFISSFQHEEVCGSRTDKCARCGLRTTRRSLVYFHTIFTAEGETCASSWDDSLGGDLRGEKLGAVNDKNRSDDCQYCLRTNLDAPNDLGHWWNSFWNGGFWCGTELSCPYHEASEGLQSASSNGSQEESTHRSPSYASVARASSPPTYNSPLVTTNSYLPQTESSGGIFICDVCGTPFAALDSYQIHVLTDHSEMFAEGGDGWEDCFDFGAY